MSTLSCTTMKILFASTSTNQTTGYGRISYNVITKLASAGHEVHHFAFQNYKVYSLDDNDRVLPHNVKIIDVHALAPPGDVFGNSIWNDTIKNVEPDLIIVYNDMPVICSLINQMLQLPKPCPFISYLDIVYEYQKEELMRHVAKYSDHIFVFSEFWKKHLVNGFGISPDDVSVFPHGIDKHKFTTMDKKLAKEHIGLHAEDFVVFNTNRNSYRKLLDITVKSFVRFWKMTGCDPKAKLLLNCRFDIQDGYNFMDIISAACTIEGVDRKQITDNNIILLSSTSAGLVTDSTINIALNASDVGINTCGGEGFGLCNAEGAYLGVPQVVTNTGGLSDIFGGFENMLVDPKVYMSLTSGIDFHNGELAICDYKDFADKLFFYYKNRDVMKADGNKIQKHIRETYDWDKVLHKFSCDIARIVEK